MCYYWFMDMTQRPNSNDRTERENTMNQNITTLDKTSHEDIKVGDRVMSFDFDSRDLEGERACYQIGTVVAFVEMFDGFSVLERYQIEVTEVVFSGEHKTLDETRTIFPPINGTPKAFGGECDGVELLPDYNDTDRVMEDWGLGIDDSNATELADGTTVAIAVNDDHDEFTVYGWNTETLELTGVTFTFATREMAEAQIERLIAFADNAADDDIDLGISAEDLYDFDLPADDEGSVASETLADVPFVDPDEHTDPKAIVYCAIKLVLAIADNPIRQSHPIEIENVDRRFLASVADAVEAFDVKPGDLDDSTTFAAQAALELALQFKLDPCARRQVQDALDMLNCETDDPELAAGHRITLDEPDDAPLSASTLLDMAETYLDAVNGLRAALARVETISDFNVKNDALMQANDIIIEQHKELNAQDAEIDRLRSHIKAIEGSDR